MALAGEPLRLDELTFHVLNRLNYDYKEIYAAIHARDTSITFSELHNKLAEYESLNCWRSTSDSSFPVTANFAIRGNKTFTSNRQSQQLNFKDTLSLSHPNNKGCNRSIQWVICQF